MSLSKPLLFVLMMLAMTACQDDATTETDRRVDAAFIALDDASVSDTGSVTVARKYVFDVNRNGLVDEDDLYPAVLAASLEHGRINALTTLEAAGFTPGELFGLLAVYCADTRIDGGDVVQMTAHVNAILVINALSAASEARGADRFETLRSGVAEARAAMANGIATNWQSAISSVSGGLTLISPDRAGTFEALVEEVKGHVGGGVQMADRLKRPEISIDANGTVTIEVSPDYPIYYTTDSSDPDVNATRYEEAFVVESGTTVKAIVIYKQMGSRVESSTYSLFCCELSRGLRRGVRLLLRRMRGRRT